MAQVAVTVNERTYEVTCEDGQEEHVAYLSEFVDKRVQELVERLGQVGEARLLLMSALLAADDLADAYEQIEKLRDELEQAEAKAKEATGEVAEAVESVITAAAHRLENIAEGLEKT